MIGMKPCMGNFEIFVPEEILELVEVAG
jgi:hypothetical protein